MKNKKMYRIFFSLLMLLSFSIVNDEVIAVDRESAEITITSIDNSKLETNYSIDELSMHYLSYNQKVGTNIFPGLCSYNNDYFQIYYDHNNSTYGLTRRNWIDILTYYVDYKNTTDGNISLKEYLNFEKDSNKCPTLYFNMVKVDSRFDLFTFQTINKYIYIYSPFPINVDVKYRKSSGEIVNFENVKIIAKEVSGSGTSNQTVNDVDIVTQCDNDTNNEWFTKSADYQNEFIEDIDDQISAIKNDFIENFGDNLENAPDFIWEGYKVILGQYEEKINSLLEEIKNKNCQTSALDLIKEEYNDVVNGKNQEFSDALTIAINSAYADGNITEQQLNELENNNQQIETNINNIIEESVNKINVKIDDVISGLVGEKIDETCQGIIDSGLIEIINQVLNWLRYIVPIGLVIFAGVDFGQVLISDDKDSMKKATSKFVKRCVIGVIIFFVPTLLTFLINIFNSVSSVPLTDLPNCGIK